MALTLQRRLWQAGWPGGRCSIMACADAALSNAGFARLASPGLAKPENRILHFRGTTQIGFPQLRISIHASLTVWAGFLRREPPACLTAGSSVNWASPVHDWLLTQARWDLAPLLISAKRQNGLRKVGGPSSCRNTGWFVSDCQAVAKVDIREVQERDGFDSARCSGRAKAFIVKNGRGV